VYVIVGMHVKQLPALFEKTADNMAAIGARQGGF
jgi:hypothetical protein